VEAERDVDGVVLGSTLLDIADGRYDSPRTLVEAKRLTRALLARQLDGQVLRSRQILKDLLRT
jgi:recombinational DNA repair protein (RecF pathway)